MLKKIMPVLGLVIIFSTAAHAGTGSGKIALGYLATSGNSDTTNLNAQIGLQYLTGKWTDTLDLAAIKSAESGESTAERYNADGKVEYDFTEKNYVFDEAQYTKDLFGGIRQRISDTVGYGRRILNSPTQSLDLQVGAGVRHETTQKPELKRTTDPIGTGQLDYHWQITKNSEFSETAKTEGGESNVFMESVTALKLRIYQNFFAQFSYTVDHNTQVPAGLKKTDTYTAISLSYEFGKQNQEG